MQSRCASARQQFGFDFSLLFLLWLGLGCRGGYAPPLVVHFPTPPPNLSKGARAPLKECRDSERNR